MVGAQRRHSVGDRKGLLLRIVRSGRLWALFRFCAIAGPKLSTATASTGIAFSHRWRRPSLEASVESGCVGRRAMRPGLQGRHQTASRRQARPRIRRLGASRRIGRAGAPPGRKLSPLASAVPIGGGRRRRSCQAPSAGALQAGVAQPPNQGCAAAGRILRLGGWPRGRWPPPPGVAGLDARSQAGPPVVGIQWRRSPQPVKPGTRSGAVPGREHGCRPAHRISAELSIRPSPSRSHGWRCRMSTRLSGRRWRRRGAAPSRRCSAGPRRCARCCCPVLITQKGAGARRCIWLTVLRG